MNWSVTCAACREWLGYSEDLEAASALFLDHDATCTATRAEKIQAAFDIRFRNITRRLEQEGFPCQ